MQIVGDQTQSTISVHETADHPDLKVILQGVGNTLTIAEGTRVYGTILLANGASVTIGANVKCTGPMVFQCHEAGIVDIGAGCLFSQNVQFRPSDAHKIFDLTTNTRINAPTPIRIGASVWIGQDVLFLKGAGIPAGCIVGARSLVNKAFDEENCILAGIPAKIVRRQVRWAP